MRGIAAASGMALAPAHILPELKILVEERAAADAAAELMRLTEAISACYSAIEAIMTSLGGVVEQDTADILDFQLLLLEDTDFVGRMLETLEERCINAEYAVQEVSGHYILYLQGLTDNDYLRERAADVADLANRLIAVLAGVADAPEPEGSYIAVGMDIPPSKVAGLNKSKLKGIILEKGGLTSHSVILSKALGIPCLVEASGILEAAEEGVEILLDGETGEITIRPDGERVSEFNRYLAGQSEERARLAKYKSRASITMDGALMRVFANITSQDEARDVIAQGGEGVGLFRSELLYMSKASRPPSEERQYREYANAAKELQGRPLVIRTLDIGGDKQIGYMEIGAESNPFLGYRAIRYCLDHPEIFEPQLAAILRAGTEGDLRMMFPMITCKQELVQAKETVESVKRALDVRGAQYDRDMKIGMMIETPAAVLDAGILAAEADFFSIGTNDLSQYLFAADRGNARVARLNSHFQPGLLRAVYSIVRAGHEAGIEVDICGQAGEADCLIPLWAGMGVDALSVSSPRIAAVRGRICSLRKADCGELLETVLSADTAGEVERALNEFIADRRIE